MKASSKAGFTALVFAAIKDDARSIESLIAAGADPNFTLPDGTKVLSVAAAYKSTVAAGALVDRGANPNIADSAGVTPLHTAASGGASEMWRLAGLRGSV